VLDQPRSKPQYSAYTGSRYSNDEIENFLQSKNIKYQRLDDQPLFDLVSDQLINAGVVGWFNGRAEFGPRALGARSIIADPRRSDAKDLLNSKIKRRESFRPFAPSILKDHVADYFELSDDVPFMEKVFPIKKEKQTSIPAVTHVDGTGRLQSVDQEVSPRYYGLIHKFYEKTGVPILLNTSFNENEPIVNSPEDALNCFLRTNMDMLVLENIVIQRKDQ
jgi:carbamoyltransferase